jgi:hypothetical protein
VLVEQTLRQQIVSVMPPTLFNFIDPELYIVFWTLSLSDINFPKEQYSKFVAQLKDQISSHDVGTRLVSDLIVSSSAGVGAVVVQLLRVSHSSALIAWCCAASDGPRCGS